MKKLMIGLVGALAIAASADVESQTVGYHSRHVSVGNRSMRTPMTFVKPDGILKAGQTKIDFKISDITQHGGTPGDLTLCLYDDNVTRLSRYIFVSSELAEEEGLDGYGWYILDNSGDPDLEIGVQDSDLTLGQGVVINSVSDEPNYCTYGDLDLVEREFSISVGARKMMGNILPVDIELNDLKQIGGTPGDLTFCTYDDNVTRLARYIYVSIEAAEENEIDSGWYILDDSGDPDLEAGVKNFTIEAGDGFVVNSVNSEAMLRFPKAQ